MDEVLNIGLASSFVPGSATHFVSERAGEETLRIDGASSLLFVVRGSLEIEASAATLFIGCREALFVSEAPRARLCCHHSQSAEWFQLLYRAASSRGASPTDGLRVDTPIRVARPERVTDLLRRYVEEHERDNPSQAVLYHLLRLVTLELISSDADRRSSPAGVEVIVSSVDAFIAAHYHEAISTFDVSHALRYNPDYLERVYRQECDISIREAIQLRRVREACAHLLRNRELSVPEIALRCGFNDPSFFRRAFKKATGVTPHGYRAAGRAERLPSPRASGGDDRRRRAHRSRRAAGKAEGREANPIEPLNAGFFVSPGHGMHARRLLDSYELIFVTQGHLDLFQGRSEYHLGPNDALLLEPGRMHGGLRPYEAGLKFYWVHFRVRENTGDGLMVEVPIRTRVGDPELVAELFCSFISDQEAGALDARSAAELIALMLCSVSRGEGGELGRRHQARGDAATLAAVVDDYIDHNFKRRISTATIAREMRFNPDYLQRVYRYHAGSSIVHALHERRIRAAREQLRGARNKNINEIALACGYNDPGYFRRIFKRFTGLTPKQYRSMFVQSHINAH